MSGYNLPSLFIVLIILWSYPSALKAQFNSQGKMKVLLKMKYVKEDGKAKVYFKVLAPESAKRNPVRFTIVNLFLQEESKYGMMGNITTDSFGEGAVPLADRFAKESEDMIEFHLLGSLKDDSRIEDLQTKLIIKPATLELSLYQQDSVRYAKAVLKEKDSSGAWVPIAGEKVNFFVQKYFTLLPSVNTDENGEALLQVPDNLRGDDAGNIKILAKLDADEKYGSLIATSDENWGSPVKNMDYQERLLSILLVLGALAIILSFISKMFKRSVVEQTS